MNTIRPRYPQQTQGYQTKQNTTDQDGHNQNAQDQQQQRQEQQVVARGRAQDVRAQEQSAPMRSPIYSPAANAYPQAFPTNQHQTYAVHTPPMVRHNGPTPMQYQTIQGGYQPVNQPIQQGQAPQQPIRSNKINIAQILKDFRNTIKAIATPPEVEEQVNKYLVTVNEQVRSELVGCIIPSKNRLQL